MVNNYRGVDDPVSYSKLINKLRDFCLKKGFYEISVQDRLSILAACEDPETVATYEYAGETWPLPQTGQMWLEYELLTKPEIPGVFCVTTSYRNEKNPVPGRHKLIFPMFEFELKGGIKELATFETEMLEYLGFGKRASFQYKKYDELKDYYKTEELSHKHENKMQDDFGPVVFCQDFPVYTSPFWNMKKNDADYANKIDVIMYGNETIGSAERSTSPREMIESFYSISDGKYAKKLFELFGEDRVEGELKDFLKLKFIQRCGGAFGMTRLISAARMHKLLAPAAA